MKETDRLTYRELVLLVLRNNCRKKVGVTRQQFVKEFIEIFKYPDTNAMKANIKRALKAELEAGNAVALTKTRFALTDAGKDVSKKLRSSVRYRNFEAELAKGTRRIRTPRDPEVSEPTKKKSTTTRKTKKHDNEGEDTEKKTKKSSSKSKKSDSKTTKSGSTKTKSPTTKSKASSGKRVTSKASSKKTEGPKKVIAKKETEPQLSRQERHERRNAAREEARDKAHSAKVAASEAPIEE